KQSTVSQTSESEPVIPQKKTFSFPKNFNKKRLSFALILGLFFLVLIGAAAGLFYYYWNVPEAEIKLFLYPKYIEKTVEINLAKSATALDLQNFIIPTSANQVTVTGEEVVPTTGTKKVGEKATGKILIYNKISKTRTLKKGAILTNAENLRFELAEDVTVASASSQSQDEGESIAYGKAEASVNAGGVGTEYNIAKDSVLTFKDIDKSSLSAKAVDAFSGGSSETVQVVDKKDKDKALESLQTKLLTQLNDELSKQTDKTKLAFDTGEKPEITESSFDHEVSDEATNLTVKATMKVNTLVISKTDFDYTLMQALMGSIPESFQISSDGLQQEIKNQTETKDGLKIEVNTKVKLLPKVDFDNIRRSIVGKYPNLIQSYFQGLPNFAKVEIVVRPSLPGFLGTLPRQEGKISIAVEEVK
ncbi:hypothetical protein GYA19_03240, partial [Candidatus Beckwithbacteria bacterium]|nr:hypothetical protein [Candidatus Beckwithbacteria bacterium]